MEISITIEGAGLGWPRWKELITELEAYGFAGIFKSDHWCFANLRRRGYIGNAARFAFETLSSLYSKRENCFD